MSESHLKQEENKKQDKSQLYQYVAIIGVVLIAAAMLVIKQVQQKNADEVANGTPPLAISDEAELFSPEEAAVIETLEEKIDRLHEDKQPIFAFFHSEDCQTCVEMMKVVEEVLPEYSGRVHLVDVNVYDEANRNLLARAQIRAIPTQLFFNSNGEITSTAGLMTPDDLRTILDQISGNQE